MVDRPIIMDGAMGTELIKLGVDCPLPIWSADANLDYPHKVKEIHSNYINSGSSIITTNTFRSTTWTYRKSGYNKFKAKERAKSSFYSANYIAQNVKKNGIRVATSITSVDDCYSPDKFPGKMAAEDTYGEILEWINDLNTDIILFETMGNLEEIKIGLKLSISIDIPIWLGLIMKDKDHLLDGSHIMKLVQSIPKDMVDCLLLNCNTIKINLDAIDSLKNYWKKEWGTYPNLGKEDYGNDYFDIINESKFDEAFKVILKKNPYAIGACCGSNPYHIAKIKNLIELS